MRRLLLTAAAAGFLVAPALAQEETATALASEQSDEHGTYLTDAEGRPVYLFTADQQGTGDQAPVVNCGEECLEIWPLVEARGEVEAQEDVDAELIGTTEHNAQSVVTYNGWPLYFFVRDEGADAPQGNDIESFGGEWYLVTPEGEKVGH